jgi:hypothetical protein
MAGSSKHRRWWADARPYASAMMAGTMVLLGSQSMHPAQAADDPAVTVELNKLEAQDKSCRAYFLIDNPGEAALSALKLDLVLFRSDGVIDRRLTLNLSPVQAHKKSVRIFDLSDLPCSNVGSVLLNDVTECAGPSGTLPQCADRLKVTSRAAAPFSK